MSRLINPFEGTSYDIRHFDIASKALKRGHNGEGRRPIEAIVNNLGIVVMLDDHDCDRIARVVNNEFGANSIEVLGNEISTILGQKIEEQWMDR